MQKFLFKVLIQVNFNFDFSTAIDSFVKKYLVSKALSCYILIYILIES